MFDKFSEELKTAREQKGLTLHQVAQKTKIDYKFLEVMEEGDFSFLPELYVKAFLKNYAKVVGLNEDIVIKKYEAAKEGRILEETQVSKPETEGKNIRKKDPVKIAGKEYVKAPSISAERKSETSGLRDKQKYIFAAAAVVILLVALFYYLFLKPDKEIIISEKPLNEIVEENQQRYLEEEKPNVQDSTYISSDSLNLNIFSSETSWVKIVYDDKSSGEFILFPQSQKNLKASSNFKITFGNSRGIKLKLNGSDVVFNASGRNVSRVMIDSSGLHYLTAPSGAQR